MIQYIFNEMTNGFSLNGYFNLYVLIHVLLCMYFLQLKATRDLIKGKVLNYSHVRSR